MDGTERVEGLKLLKRLEPFWKRLRPSGCQRDRAGNRTLFFDHACSLILLSFFTPPLTSLRDLQRASGLTAVRRKLGVSSTSLGSLSESLRVFDPELPVEVLQELLTRIPDAASRAPQLQNLSFVPTAVDGTLLRQLPQITQASFATRRDQDWKLHTHFEVLRGVAVRATLTDASSRGDASEHGVLRRCLEPDRCGITDRGYECFALFNEIVAAGSSYVCRVKNDHHFEVDPDRRPERPFGRSRGGGRAQGRSGTHGGAEVRAGRTPDHLQRRIVGAVTPHPKRGGRRRAAASQDLVLVTNLQEVPAEIIVLLYRFRWLIELFFRWLKCVLGCRHLLSQSAPGIEIQMYCAEGGKLATTDPLRFPPACAELIRRLLCLRIGELMGLDDTFADWNCHGAGLHSSPPGASLGVHLDSDHHPLTGWQRACNAILFVNTGWKPDWGGAFELWSDDGSECLKRITPRFNRLVLFEPSDISFHAVARNTGPEPRKTLATFYWQKSMVGGQRSRAEFC